MKKIKPLIEILNGFFTSDSKGWNCLKDIYGITPNEFSKLSLERKQSIVRDFIKGFKNILANDVVSCGLSKETIFDYNFDEALLYLLIETGEAADALLQLIYHYDIDVWSSEQKVMEE